jgi:hypothetical protein
MSIHFEANELVEAFLDIFADIKTFQPYPMIPGGEISPRWRSRDRLGSVPRAFQLTRETTPIT